MKRVDSDFCNISQNTGVHTMTGSKVDMVLESGCAVVSEVVDGETRRSRRDEFRKHAHRLARAQTTSWHHFPSSALGAP